VLIRWLTNQGFGPSMQFSPLAVALGFILLASGFKNIKQFRYEFLIVILIATYIPLENLFKSTLNITVATAQVAYNVLYYLGFEVTLEGTKVILPTGAIDVNLGCSGLEVCLQLLRLSILFLVLFPTQQLQKLLLPIIAVMVGYVTNGVRIALLAYIVAFGSGKEMFDYWHEGEGSNIFSIISMGIFALICRVILWIEETKHQTYE